MRRKELQRNPEDLVAERTAQLDRQKEFLDHVINAVADPIFVKDEQHRWTILNDAFCRFIGHPREHLLGKSDFDFFPREEAEVFWAKDDEVFARGGENISEERFTDAAGLTKVIATKKSIFTDRHIGEKVLVGIIRDITDRKKSEEEIRSLNERLLDETRQLEAANQELEAFSYSVSHDLRAPLRAIDGFSQAVQEDYGDRLDEEGRRLLKVVRANTSRMGTLIDDLLAFSRAARSELKFAPVDMGALAFSAMEEAAPQGRAEGAVLRIGSLPETQGDATLLRQVWVNLLQNALKFSAGRTPPVIEVGGAVEHGEAVYFVRDNGVGFDMRFVHKLFSVFQRLHKAEEFAGTGAGLAIVKRIVTRHGGRVWAEGRPGEGATFWFSFPFRREAAHGRR